MAYCTRVFCRGAVTPTLSDVLMYLRQHEVSALIVGGASQRDLMSPDWSEVVLAYDAETEPVTVRCCHQGTAAGLSGLRAEVADFLQDLDELPPGPRRDQVVAHLRETRVVLVVEFPASDLSPQGYEGNGWLMNLFVTEADGLVQSDGVGFLDENDEIILRLG